MRTFFPLILLSFLATIVPLICIAEASDSEQSTPDIVAPEISTIKVPDMVSPGSELKMEINASDDLGIKSVVVYFRQKGERQYSKLQMTHVPGTNKYYLEINNVPSAGIEYYIEAIDLAGNLVRNGQDVSPLKVVTFPELDSSVIENMKDGRLNDQDILTLFRNNTVDAYHVRQNFTFTRYYALDNQMVEKSAKKGIRQGHWRVINNTLCEQFDKQEYCAEIVKEGKTITKFVINRKGDRVVSIVYKQFRYGNPENL
jgi:hypothetical protein